jgi:kinetochor protein Mis14/NSL1
MVSEFEVLDTKLAERIRALEATKEALTEKVADLRRTAPSQAAKDFQEQWVKDGAAFDARMEQQDNDSSNSHVIAIGNMKRWDDVQARWNRGSESLVALKGNLTETVAHLERATAVVEHMES